MPAAERAAALRSHLPPAAEPPRRARAAAAAAPPFRVHIDAAAVKQWPDLPALLRGALRAAAPSVEVTDGVWGGGGGRRCDTLILSRAEKGDYHRVFAATRPVRLVVPHAGVAPQLSAAVRAADPRPKVYNVHHNARPTAEVAVALLLAAARRLIPADAALRRGDWSWRQKVADGGSGSVHLSGRPAVVLGYGAIGQAVARTLVALGMEVSAVRRTAGGGGARDGAVALHPPTRAALRRLLSAAAAVVVCLPLTDGTRGLLGAEEVGWLPRGAVLVNTGRAEVVDEGAVYARCRARTLTFAADVWWDETGAARPGGGAPSRHDFAALDNVVMTPHFGGGRGLDGVEQMRADAVAALVKGFVHGPEPPELDLALGY